MHPHRVPRQVDVDQGVAVFLEVNALTGRLRRDEEADGIQR